MASAQFLRLPRQTLLVQPTRCLQHIRHDAFTQTIRQTRQHNFSILIRSPVYFNSHAVARSSNTAIFSTPFTTLITHLRLPRIRQPQFPTKRFQSTTKSPSNPPKVPPAGPAESTISSTTTTAPVNEASLTLGQRMKKLSKEYGYSAVAVYFLLSLIDFPFCFLTVRFVGTDTIAKYEHRVIEAFWQIVPDSVYHREPHVLKAGEPGFEGDVEAERRETGKNGDEKKGVSIWTELALAYALHKSLIFFRVPLTAAVTPKIVQKLRGWGFNIGTKGGIKEGVGKNFPRQSKKYLKEAA